jgi:hypothetical protein
MNPDRREFLRLSDVLARQAGGADDCRHLGQFEWRIPSIPPIRRPSATRCVSPTCRQIPVAAMLMAGMDPLPEQVRALRDRRDLRSEP